MSSGVDNNNSQQYWLIVVELDDVVPRRDLAKPNLFVGLTLSPPEVRFEQIKRSKRKTWYLGQVRKLREDLSSSLSFEDEGSAEAGLKAARERLLEEGYTVNRITTIWQVYVLELDQSKSTDPRKKPVYVGETSTTPERRMQQHLGELLSKKNKPLTTRSTKGKVVGLLPELMSEEIYFSKQQALVAEAAWAKHLRELDYDVSGGH